MKMRLLLRSLRLAMELAIAIALTLAWTPWVSPARAIVPGWDNTGAMGSTRENHTATLLGNGMVLIAGGYSTGVHSSAEIYLPEEVAAPTFTPTPGTYTTAQSVTISTTTSGATIRYTTDSSAPGETVGTVYSGLISVTGTMTIKAVAYQTGLTTSSVSTGAYTITSPGTS